MAADLRALVKQMAEAKGLGQYWPIIEQLIQLESGWDPTTPSAYNAQGTEDSWGLFQLNRMSQGLGTGYSVTALKNPRTNAEIALSKIASIIQSGGTIQDALGDWVNARNQIFSGQGGVTMAGQAQTTTPTEITEVGNEAWQKFMQTIIAGLMSDDPVTQQTAAYTVSQLPTELQRQFFGLSGAEAGTATTTTTIPSAQETAAGQWDMETWLSDAEFDRKKYGDTVAAENFANKIAAAQEGRLQATAAQEYAQQIAPPGMTTMPGVGRESVVGQLGEKLGFAPRADIPLPLAPAGSFGEAMQQAQQYVPQAPELQYQPGALPQMPNLAALPSTQQSTQVTVPYTGAGVTLPTGLTGGGQESSLMQAIRNYIARFGQTFPGGQLPVGR